MVCASWDVVWASRGRRMRVAGVGREMWDTRCGSRDVGHGMWVLRRELWIVDDGTSRTLLTAHHKW